MSTCDCGWTVGMASAWVKEPPGASTDGIPRPLRHTGEPPSRRWRASFPRTVAWAVGADPAVRRPWTASRRVGRSRRAAAAGHPAPTGEPRRKRFGKAPRTGLGPVPTTGARPPWCSLTPVSAGASERRSGPTKEDPAEQGSPLSADALSGGAMSTATQRTRDTVSRTSQIGSAGSADPAGTPGASGRRPRVGGTPQRPGGQAGRATGTRVHFLGIGGSGLAPLARIAMARGDTVSGSDQDVSERVETLRSLGARIRAGAVPGPAQLAAELAEVDVVVASSALPDDRPEIVAARAAGLPVRRRSDWLPELTADYRLVAVAGSHGKSTTSAMLTVVLRAAGADPTAVIGAEVPQLGGGALVGGGEIFVLEADEYG